MKILHQPIPTPALHKAPLDFYSDAHVLAHWDSIVKTENLYIIWAHPRTDSLTANVVKAMQERAEQQGIKVTSLDLYRNNFEPILALEDEPDWNNPRKQYAPDIHQLYAELDANDTIAMVFPVWWFSFPAIMKGYLDRIWTNGLAYGLGSTLKGKKFRYIALVGGSASGFITYGWEKNMTDYLTGMMNYLNVDNTRIAFLYNTLGLEESSSEAHYLNLFEQARGVVDDLNIQ